MSAYAELIWYIYIYMYWCKMTLRPILMFLATGLNDGNLYTKECDSTGSTIIQLALPLSVEYIMHVSS